MNEGQSEPDSFHVSNPFVAERKSRTQLDTHGLKLPRDVVERAGFETRKGNLNLRLAIMARVAELQRRYGDRTETLTFEHGGSSFAVLQKPATFIASVESLCRSVYRRVYKALPEALPTAGDPDTTIVGHCDSTPFEPVPTWQRFYESERKTWYRNGGVKVQGERYVADLGHAAPEGAVKGKGRDLFGKEVTCLGTPLYDAVGSPETDAALPVVFCTGRTLEAPQSRRVAVLQHFERVAAERYGLYRYFTSQRTGYGNGFAHRYITDGLAWQRKQRKTRDNGERHASIGAFRPTENTKDMDPRLKDRRACTVPYLVAEIDGASARESMNAATLLVVGSSGSAWTCRRSRYRTAATGASTSVSRRGWWATRCTAMRRPPNGSCLRFGRWSRTGSASTD